MPSARTAGEPWSCLDHCDDLALDVGVALDVALGGGEAGVTGELLDVPERAPPASTILRAARVMKVLLPECDEHPTRPRVSGFFTPALAEAASLIL